MGRQLRADNGIGRERWVAELDSLSEPLIRTTRARGHAEHEQGDPRGVEVESLIRREIIGRMPFQEVLGTRFGCRFGLQESIGQASLQSIEHDC